MNSIKDIILIALEQEAPAMAKWDNVFFTGVGKVNAAVTTATLLERYPECEHVYNFGTVGGITHDLGGLHHVGNFVQRDMLCQPMGVQEGITPFEHYTTICFQYDALICSTGDNFVTDSDLTIKSDVVDMEAYAIAKAVIKADRDIKFHCYKYVSDNANEESKDDWHENVANGEPHYIEQYERLTNG